MNVLRDQAVLDLNVNNDRVRRRQVQATRDRFEVGEVTRTDGAQAESRLALAIADRTQAEGNLETSRANYQQIIGKLPENLQWPGSPPNLPESQEGAITVARQDNPAVLATRSEEHTSELQSLMRISYAVFCLKKKNKHTHSKIKQITT